MNDPTATCWQKHFSQTHKTFYWFNTQTGEKSWTNPEVEKDNTDVTLKRSNQSEAENVNKKVRLESTSTTSSGDINLEKKSIIKTAIIVPFRDLHIEQNRRKHLEEFIPYMVQFLNNSPSNANKTCTYTYEIYIIQQSNDNRKFNRGKLLNIGYDIAKKKGCNLFIFHDVDLLPSNELLKYYYYTDPNLLKATTIDDTDAVASTVDSIRSPLHIARVWNRYNSNKSYFGGIVLFTAKLYELINGFPNNFWGWGGEDDEMYRRVKLRKLSIDAPKAQEGGYICVYFYN